MALPRAASMEQGDVIWSFSHTHTHGSAVGCARSYSRPLTLPPCPGHLYYEKERRGGGGRGMHSPADTIYRQIQQG